MKMKLSLPIFLIIVLTAAAIIYFSTYMCSKKYERFGTSPGTLIQLASTRVLPTCYYT